MLNDNIIIEARNKLRLSRRKLSELTEIPERIIKKFESFNNKDEIFIKEKENLFKLSTYLDIDFNKLIINLSLPMEKFRNEYYKNEKALGKEEIFFSSWQSFLKYFLENIFQKFDMDLIWRGQENPKWLLQSSLVRNYSENEMDEELVGIILNYFKEALRGKTEAINIEHIELLHPGIKINDNEEKGEIQKEIYKYLSLGQHYGLNTPLLDWTKSPFIASYFAFSNLRYNESNYRVVYAINKPLLLEMLEKNGELSDNVKLLEERTHFNLRLINQQGIFIYGPLKTDLENWILTEYSKYSSNNLDIELFGVDLTEKKTILYKFFIPNYDRNSIMKFLNIMNINPTTLFPDVSGAAKTANLNLELGI